MRAVKRDVLLEAWQGEFGLEPLEEGIVKLLLLLEEPQVLTEGSDIHDGRG
jgi:hypothetical protein